MSMSELSSFYANEINPSTSLESLDDMAEPEKKDYYRRMVPLARVLLSARYHTIVEGLENIPNQASMFVINHIVAADSVIVPAIVTSETGIPLRMAAKQEYFAGEGLNDTKKFGKSIKWFMENTGQIEVDRDLTNPRSIMRLGPQIDEIVNERGEHFGIHGEGTRSQNGMVNRMFNSIGRWSYDYSIPIVPVGLHYFPTTGALHRTPVTVRFGEPLMPESYHSEDNIVYHTKGLSRKAQVITDIVEERVALLAGLERSGEFAFNREARAANIK